MFKYLIFESISIIVGIVAIATILIRFYKYRNLADFFKLKTILISTILLIVAIFTWTLSNKTYAPDFAMPTFNRSHAPGGLPPSIPFTGMLDFFTNKNRFEKVKDIGADPNDVPTESQKPDADGIVRISLRAQEVISEIAPEIYFNYWTYNGQTPGPMLRVKEGDTVEVALTNDPTSLHDHNIDLHAVTGPGGGAKLTHVAPGETKIFKFKALNPGLYVYHCATPNVSTHNSHGQYGLILVEPKEKLEQVDKEFYIVQGELYTMGQIGKKGLIPFDAAALIDGKPNYVTFNGKIQSAPRMYANVGDKIRIYVGNGGVNLISSFHVIGEIFDTVYPNASIGGSLEHNTQTALVLPGGSTIVEFTVDVPGTYLLVDHALARMNKGAWAELVVRGNENHDIFSPIRNDHME
ncbi:MAG: nitrite reductase, copper-containing [Candidatus Magasanikbacteria bacterium RIFCSPLOWO2_02_FULL_44_11]|uniref:Copper-containing nitrite reductase n=2 Tax=Candidatus Magasanikiibacteriota TaxID=1752731 RepID=A0A1F6NA81_9BACT|nr:MAG: nitrite reductase, copper-containing [Candidatus Magasanikbacteria bacterium RIFCSPHIGHO2_02_FULL_45_10]OGH80807.1 MAG: nitrite reductase, copper-containing [Candidatus Magasanikbacteria bacterium RIFCSPLOWO2_02_FULL_44_11]